MAAYCLFDNFEVIDSAKLAEYKDRVVPVVAHYDGHYVVLGGKPIAEVSISFP